MKVIFDTDQIQEGKFTVMHKPNGQIGLYGLQNTSSWLYEALLIPKNDALTLSK